jgi:polypeptide N-acetylgalactosaminyltransferase
MVPGMMVAMRKEFFLQLGGFDTGMEIWGSEHMELSTKVWLCGGIVQMIPCSKIGHLYRGAHWQKIYPDAKYIWKNILRFILVWMEGEEQKLALEVLQKGSLSKKVNPGDLRDRYRIKADNKCKPYQYYIDQLKRISNAYIPDKIQRKGIIFNHALKTCLDLAQIDNKLKLISYPCTGHGNQFFILTQHSNIRVDRAWLKAELETSEITLSRDFKDWSTPEFKWSFESNGSIVHNGMCLNAENTGEVSLKTCEESPFQRWDWPPQE